MEVKETKMQKSLFRKILQKHSLAMLICCAVPLTLFAVLSLTGTLGSWGFYALIFLCPLLHVLMMRGHMWPNDHAKGHARPADDPKRLIPPPNVSEGSQRTNKESM